MADEKMDIDTKVADVVDAGNDNPKKRKAEDDAPEEAAVPDAKKAKSDDTTDSGALGTMLFLRLTTFPAHCCHRGQNCRKDPHTSGLLLL